MPSVVLCQVLSVNFYVSEINVTNDVATPFFLELQVKNCAAVAVPKSLLLLLLPREPSAVTFPLYD